MKANPTGYLWSKYEGFLMSGCQDMGLLENYTAKWNGSRDDRVTTIALCTSCSRAKIGKHC